MKETIHILLLEDNPGDARLIKEFLRENSSFKFSLTHVERLEAGLESLNRDLADVILLDLGLPDSQGLATLEKIITPTAMTPVIVLTGLNDSEIVAKALQAGAQDYLIKGEFNSELLLRAIRYAIARAQAEEEVRRRVNELEVLYAISLVVGRLLKPEEIGQEIIKILSEKLKWHHATIRRYNPENDTLELLAFQQPGLENEADRRSAEEQFRTMIVRPGQGMAGWVIEHGQSVRSGDLTRDWRFGEAWSNIHSGLYAPLKMGNKTIGILSVESEKENAFTETDERLVTTVAAQTASAIENARHYEETRQRLMKAEAVYKISLDLKTARTMDKMLSNFCG